MIKIILYSRFRCVESLNIKIMMTAKEQIQSIDIYPIHGTSDESSPDLMLCNSRFFRTKQKQILSKTQSNIKGMIFENLFLIF
jgi:hypothetical protein